MRYCHSCHKITRGKPYFCNFCGSSYGVKLCGRLHPNPRLAHACSQCGSRDLSTPQPRIPLLLRPLLFLLGLLPKILGLALVVGGGIWGLTVLLQDARFLQTLVCLGMLAMGLVVFWTLAPKWLRRFLVSAYRLFFSKREGSKRKQHT
jgi:RNA polymerase subunit RPABC4/transcription elongation factor Spt4